MPKERKLKPYVVVTSKKTGDLYIITEAELKRHRIKKSEIEKKSKIRDSSDPGKGYVVKFVMAEQTA